MNSKAGFPKKYFKTQLSELLEKILVEGYITVEDIREYLKVNRVTIYRWIAAGKLKPDHHWSGMSLFKKTTVLKFINKYILPKRIPKSTKAISEKMKRIMEFSEFLKQTHAQTCQILLFSVLTERLSVS